MLFLCASSPSATQICIIFVFKLSKISYDDLKNSFLNSGKHLDKPRKKIVYRQAKQIKMVSPKEFDVCVDGEMIKGNNFVVEVCPKAIKLVPPQREE